MNKNKNKQFQIDDILDSIEINSIHSLSPSSSNRSPSTKIIRTEMPISSPYMQGITIGPGGGSRNNPNSRRKKYILFKGLIFCIILLCISLVAYPYYHHHTALFQEHDKDDDFMNEFGGPNRAYAPLQHNSNNNNNNNNNNAKKELPALPTTGSLSAAEKLQCPKSVLNFVINATDAKDECDGLRKAFDRTCGGGNTDNDAKASQSNHNFRRMLSLYNDESDFDDGLTESSVWGYSISAFVNKVLSSYYPSMKRRLQETVDDLTKNENSSEVEDDGGDVDEIETSEDEEKKETKPLSPALPTISGPMTDKMAEDALGLNSELSDIAKAIEELGNSTDESDRSKMGHKDQHHGKAEHTNQNGKDITSTAVAVSTIMNNPDVIEIQSCCRSILQVFHDECDSPDSEEYADRRLFVVVCVIALCGMIKSLIRHFRIRWLPEAGGCILVGVIGGLFLKMLPNIDFAFSHDMFLRVLVPPIGKLHYDVLFALLNENACAVVFLINTFLIAKNRNTQYSKLH